MDPLGIPFSVFLLWICNALETLEVELPAVQSSPIDGAFDPEGGGSWVQPSLPRSSVSAREGDSAGYK